MSAWRVDFAPEALAQIDRIRAWWLENRHGAPDLFDAEFVAVLKTLRMAPGAGKLYREHSPIEEVRRMLMPRSRYHIYYAMDRANSRVWILAAWHSSRGAGPAL